MWTQGAIGIPSGNGGMTSVSYWVKHYDNESQFGIDNGRISKLTLVQDSKVVYNYDRGEDVEPPDIRSGKGACYPAERVQLIPQHGINKMAENGARALFLPFADVNAPSRYCDPGAG